MTGFLLSVSNKTNCGRCCLLYTSDAADDMQCSEFVEDFLSSDFINKEQKMCVLLGDLTLISYIKKVEQFLLLLIL